MTGFGRRRFIEPLENETQEVARLEAPPTGATPLALRRRSEAASPKGLGSGSAPPFQAQKSAQAAWAQPEPAPASVSPLAAHPAEIDRRNALQASPAAAAIQRRLYDRIDPDATAKLGRPELQRQIEWLISEIATEQNLRLSESEQRLLAASTVDDMVGLGPLEVLWSDESITDVLVNGWNEVFVERGGKLELTGIVFRDNDHVMRVAQRIARRVGRRVDESSPMVDARLEDGSRVNIVLPPLALDGPAISIRRFSRREITLDDMVRQQNISAPLARFLQIATACRLNVLVSGGTGSGKTTLLNALSRFVDPRERVITIEDAAEIQLQQPHVVRLETRPQNSEGRGEVTMRSLVKNALRMRPDRIIIGEVRGDEVLDMLQAMNTGHDGSMSTIHANRPRDVLTRLENMANMAAGNISERGIRTQIAGALDLIVQISRMRDGKRRVTSVTEVVGMESDVVATQELFKFDYSHDDENGAMVGEFRSQGLRPRFMERAAYYGLEEALREVST